jgi:hypothetical protein
VGTALLLATVIGFGIMGEWLAAESDQQIDRMRRRIYYHLAHARSTASVASPTARASIAASAQGLVRALERLHAERDLFR